MDDEDRLNAHLDDNPGDKDARLVLSDLYEEAGRDEDAGRERWLVKVGRHSVFGRDMTDVSNRWDWFPDGWDILFCDDYDTAGIEPATLPDPVFNALGISHYATRREAEADLWRVHHVYDGVVLAARPAE